MMTFPPSTVILWLVVLVFHADVESFSCPTNRGHRLKTSLGTGAMEIYSEPSSRSPTINWAAYELDVPFPNSSNDEIYLQTFDDDDDTAVFESGATLIHLLSKANSVEARRYESMVSWILWANASLGPVWSGDNQKGLMSAAKLRKPNENMEVLEKILSKKEYLVEGGFSIADIAVSSYLLLPRFLKDIDLNRWPNVVQYMLRCASREGYRKSHSPQVKNLVIAFLGKVQEEKLLTGFEAPSFCFPGIVSSTRRSIMSSIAAMAISIPTSALALQAPPIEGRGGLYQARVEGAGAGADLFTLKPTVTDVIYLPSLIGLWQCKREVLQVDGDTEQAEQAWVALGGFPEDFKKPTATYLTRYINSTDGLVLDRGFEVHSRQHKVGVVSWEVTRPNSITFGPTELCVVQRSVEPPSDEGWGFNELIRITGAAGGIFGDTKVVKVARVKRRYRRAYADSGDRIIEGLEIVKTYRVLDGIAGELPTSTTKSRIQMTRPP